ncbi:Zn-dependent protease with chaperone function, partial [Snodgrassella alvi SCGC AB-598-O11]
SDGIFVMDGSRRSGHGNAYFTGLGKHKRIVFFDTLLKDMQISEVEAVLAHELGHFAHKHVFKQMIVTFILALIIFAVLGWLLPQTGFYTGLGVHEVSHAMALLLFMLVLPVFTFPFSPLSSVLSRKNEFEADRFAAKYANADDLIHALSNLYRTNASSLVSDIWYSRFYDS